MKPVVNAERSDRIFTLALMATVFGAIAALFVRELLAVDTVRLDFAVYRQSIQSMLSGRGLYEYSIDAYQTQFPFTYPPFAALVMMPIALMPLATGQAIWTLVQLLGCWGLAWLALTRPIPGRLPRTWHGTALLVLAWLALLSSAPVVQSLLYGQISLVVVALVVLDFAVVPARFRGILTGIAGAIKLLPLIYLPYFLITRQWRAAANTAFGFVGATGLAFVVLPRESVQFWTTMVAQTSRVGDESSLRNKSLLGLLSHGNIGGVWQQALWLGLALGVLGVGLWRARRHHQRGEEYAAMLVVGLISALISPISWVHHLIWLPLVALYFVVVGGRWRVILGVVMVAVVSYWSPVMTPVNLEASLFTQVLQSLLVPAMIVLVVLGLPKVAAPTSPESALLPATPGVES
jgi:alpha-1,2-mannosyltransferase